MSVLWPIYLAIALVMLRLGWRRFSAGDQAGTAFWTVLAILFVAADWMPPAVVGGGLLLVGVLSALPQGKLETLIKTVQASEPRTTVLRPALLIPLLTVALMLIAKTVQWQGQPLLDATQATLYGLACSVLLVWWATSFTWRVSPRLGFESGVEVLDRLGWAAVLPLALATLGAVFAKAGLGVLVSDLVRLAVPADSGFLLVVAYALGMAVFTMVMGNAFAAFPVLSIGIAVPLLIQGQGYAAAPVVAIGMLSGYCGTLMTPMAANFNLVPAILLELKDRNAVIKAQAPTGAALLIVNILLIYFLAKPA
ncbi:MAG: DUF979 family protein [Ahniella sp.]|nr:DUF979 family protein [Ahniella sp.]